MASLINRAKAALSVLRGRSSQAGFIIPVGGSLHNNVQNLVDYVENADKKNLIVYSITRAIASKFASVPIYVYQVTNEAEFKRYKALTHHGSAHDKNSLREAKKIKGKALKSLDKHPLIELLERPNSTQSSSQFFENLILQRLILGAGTARATRDNDGKGAPLELLIKPTQYVRIMVDRDDPFVPSQYQVRTPYLSEMFSPEDVLYWKYTSLDWSSVGSQLYGMSPLEAAAMTVIERNMADKTSATRLQNHGARGLVFSDADDEDAALSVEDKSNLQDKLDENVNGMRNAGRLHVVNKRLGYVDLAKSAVDMGIETIKKMSREDLCNLWGYPPVKMDPSNGSYENMNQAMRDFVINKIIPEWISLRDSLNAWLLPMYPDGRRLWIEPDFSAIPEMQEDLEKQVSALQKLWQLSPNQVLSYLGWEINANDANMNKVYIPANLVPLDQVNQLADDIDDDLKELNTRGLNDYK